MNILAQCGFGPKDKLERGLNEGAIAGVVLSPRYLTPDRMRDQIRQLRGSNARIMMDPEFFATTYMRHPEPNLGTLEQWEYFRAPRRGALISGTAIPGIIEQTLQAQAELGLDEWIAPNVYIGKADSIDTAIALNFLAQSKAVASRLGDAPVFATLAFDRDAILNEGEFREILDALTAIENPPDGYYVLIGSGMARESGGQVRSDIDQPQVIAGWMYTNYVLSINGARVLNGYCHLLSPLLGISGADAIASGWFSGLRKFSMSKYAKEVGGGRFPLVRYVSAPLLSHIKQTDFDAFRAVVPEIATGSAQDAAYDGEEPSRTEEALQSWEALGVLSQKYCTGDTPADLVRFKEHIGTAIELWAEIQEAGFTQGVESNLERLEAMQEGITLFEKWAELE
jgi:hypothetical protein